MTTTPPGWPRMRACSAAPLLAVLALAACASPPLRVVRQTEDQVSICRDTEKAEFQDAEDMAAAFCGRRELLPRLAGTDRCARHAVRYDYICVAPHY